MCDGVAGARPGALRGQRGVPADPVSGRRGGTPDRRREDHWLDFKRDCYGASNEDKRECRRDIAAFANASGGTLVVGADESNHVLSGFAPVPDPHGTARWIDEIVKEQLEPVPAIEPHVITLDGRPLLVVNVPPIPVLVGRRTGEGYEFPIRAADSRRYLTLSEVEARMHDSGRRLRLRIQQIAADAGSPSSWVTCACPGVLRAGWSLRKASRSGRTRAITAPAGSVVSRMQAAAWPTPNSPTARRLV